VRITLQSQATKGKISSYETTVSTNFETCLQESDKTQVVMSLEKPTNSPQTPQEGSSEEITSKEDPLYRILSAEEDSDWEYAFMGAIRKPSTTTAPFLSRGEDTNENLDQDKQSQELDGKSPPQTRKSVIKLVHNNEPIEICEFNLPVTNDSKPEGSYTIAEEQGADSQPISCPAPGLDNLWSQESISAPLTSFSASVRPLGVYQDSPNPYCTAPLHIVEGRDDPEDEGICMTSPPPTKFLSPAKNFEKPITPTAQNSPQKPEEFFEKCDILKWAIDDQDIGEMPGISCAQPQTDIPTTVTSESVNRQLFVKPDPTTSLFITKIKEEVEDPGIAAAHATPPVTQAPNYMETFSSPPVLHKRKRGRPSKNEPRDITPRLPRLPRTHSSDSEYAYVSDSGDLLTDDEVSALKYRRMRDLNNEASKRCRQTRKEKMVSKEAELNSLTERNAKLKRALVKMEAQVQDLKSKFLAEISNPSTKIAMARRQMMSNRLGYNSNIIGSLMDTECSNLPDVNAFWSV